MKKSVDRSYALLFAVFTCGAVVMVFEVLASRVLGPYLGTSFYTWTSIIGVIMASLSLGYYLGGRLADRRASYELLSLIIFLAALALLGTVLVRPLVLNFVSYVRWGIEIESVLAASVLFAVPSVFLAMITPFSVKIKLANLKDSASTVGKLYALSTIGSIFGTFLAGFFLIPFFGTSLLMNLLVVVLVLVSVIIFPKKHKALKLLVILASVLLIYLNATKVSAMTKNDPLVMDTEYNSIWVFGYVDASTKKPALGLQTDPYGVQSSMFVDAPAQLVFDYTKFYRLAEFFRPDFKKAMMIGGCGYSFPKFFLDNYQSALLDVIEIDPALTDVARKYFSLKDDPRMRIFHEDGRTFLNESTEKYDVIYGDAFNSFSAVPFQLTTREAVQKMSDMLNQNGVVIINLIGSLEGKGSDFLKNEYATFAEVFPKVYLFRVSNIPNSKVQNVVLVALNGEDKLVVDKTKRPVVSELVNQMIQTVIDPESVTGFLENVQILTDDFAPVEYFKYKSL